MLVVANGAELNIRNIGSERESTSITVDDGKVSDLTVNIQTGRTSLSEAMLKAKELHEWFTAHGYKTESDSVAFAIIKRNSVHPIEPIIDFKQAEAAFLNPNLKLTEMIVFGLRSGDVKVGVTLMNIRRMRAKVNKQYDNESNVIDEKVYGLDLFIAEVVKPYKPTSK